MYGTVPSDELPATNHGASRSSTTTSPLAAESLMIPLSADTSIRAESLASMRAVQPHYPPHFERGSLIQLATGELRRVEDMRMEDFVRSATLSAEIQLDSSVVTHMSALAGRDTVLLGFSVGPQRIQMSVESTVEHPFFVFHRGWASFRPDRTLRRYRLPCSQLAVGDTIVSLTQKDLSALLPPQHPALGLADLGLHDEMVRNPASAAAFLQFVESMRLAEQTLRSQSAGVDCTLPAHSADAR